MFFASDNAGIAHPQVMEHVLAANTGYVPSYGADDLTQAVTGQLRDLFEAPQAAVYLVATGTAANALALACYAQPWQTVFCSPPSHIQEDECNAPEFYTGGAKLILVPGSDKMTPDALHASMAAEGIRGVHGPQRGPVSITQVTERGQVYSIGELGALSAVAKEFGAPVHLDGARFANAMVALGCTPAEMTWKAGVDVVSFGGTKNGCMGVEAVVFFDPEKAWEFELRRKRGAHLFSKHRYLAAQMQGYLADDLWLKMAAEANASCTYLAQGMRAKGVDIPVMPHANLLFVRRPRSTLYALRDAGVAFNVFAGSLDGDDPNEMLMLRLVCDWALTREQIDTFLDLV